MCPEGVINPVRLAPDQNGVVIPVEPYRDRILDIVDGVVRPMTVDRILIRFSTDPTRAYIGANSFVVIPGKLWGCAVVDGKYEQTTA